MMTIREKKALQNFAAGDSCAQSVLKAYANLVGLTEAQAALLAAGLGGGMGRLRETCGAFTAATMLCGALEGENGADRQKRADVYARVQRMHQRFTEELGSISCAELLGRPRGPEAPEPDARTAEYYHSRPCARIIRTACQIMEEQIAERKNRPLNVLILSAHTGGGHDAAAKAIQEALIEQGANAQVMDCLAFGGAWLSRVVSGTYVRMVQHVPRGFGLMYRASQTMSTARHKSPVYLFNSSYAFRMERTLDKFKPDLIVCTHIFGAHSVTHLKRKGSYTGPLALIMTDYTLHPFAEDVEMDVLYVPHEDMIAECRDRGVPEEKVRAVGIPVGLNCLPCDDKAAAKRAAGLDPARREVLLVGGSMGAGNLPDLITELLPALGENGHMTIVCGSNEHARETAQERFGNDGRLTILGRVSPLSPLMAAADVLVTKPGGLTISEAMTIGTPMVIARPIAGCETINASFLEKKGLALFARTPEELPDKVQALLSDDSLRTAMIDCQQREIDPDTARHIADDLMVRVARPEATQEKTAE